MKLTLRRSAVGQALAKNNRPLVYGGLGKAPEGMYGLMGAVSYAVAQGGGKVTGVIPYAILLSGGEGDKAREAAQSKGVELDSGLSDDYVSAERTKRV